MGLENLKLYIILVYIPYTDIRTLEYTYITLLSKNSKVNSTTQSHTINHIDDFDDNV